MHLPTTMVPHEVASCAQAIEQLDLRLAALQEVQTMEGQQFVIYFDYDDYEIICVDGKAGYQYNPVTDLLIGG